MKLAQALPDLVSDLESALLTLGRGDLLAQVKAASLASWSYDDFADTTTLVLLPSKAAERLALYDELGVSLDTDVEGRLCAIEILDGKRVTSLLER